MTHEQFIAKLEKAGINYTVCSIDDGTLIEVGRFTYRFNEGGQLRGGWMKDCGNNWGADREQWAALLNEPTP